MHNKLLQRQLQKYISNEAELPEEMITLLKVISESYDHYEKDRKMLERSIELSSDEMIELNENLRKESKETQKAHKELKLLFDNIGEVFFTVEMQKNRLTQISNSCVDVYGYTPEEFYADQDLWNKVILQDDLYIINANYPTMQAGKPFSQQYRILHRNGSIRWLETKIIPTLEKGMLVRIDGVTADITESIQAREELIKLNESLQTTIDRLNEAQHIAHLGSWSWDAETQTFQGTEEYYKIYGISAEDFPPIIEEYINLIHTDDRERVLKILRQAHEDHQPYSYEARIITKYGTLKTVFAQGKTIEEEGKLIKMYGTLQDITERKKVRQELEQKIEQLKKSNHELDKFVYSVSHDLRAPLSSMLGLIEIAELETKEPAMNEFLEMLKKCVKRLDGFISDILNYSRNSRLDIKKEEINFIELFNEIAQNLKFMGGANHEVEIKIDVSNKAQVYGDKNRLNIILNNLISNAIRYQNSKISNPFVDIKIDTSDIETVIIVRDNGIGICKEQYEKIFEMFYRANEKSVGSGLGLYIVKETVNKLNGRIEVFSELGKGTEFHVVIPNS